MTLNATIYNVVTRQAREAQSEVFRKIYMQRK